MKNNVFTFKKVEIKNKILMSDSLVLTISVTASQEPFVDLISKNGIYDLPQSGVLIKLAAKKIFSPKVFFHCFKSFDVNKFCIESDVATGHLLEYLYGH